MGDLDPIETVYRGDRFRSRTEARWAVFFHEIDIDYLYEHQGYDLDGLYYLPDFWLPNWKVYVEIKPANEPTYEELQKAYRLSCQSRRPVVLVQGRPGVEYIDVGRVDIPAPAGHEVSIFMGEPWDRIEHDRVKVWEAADKGQLEFYARRMRGMFLEEIWFTDTPESVETIRGRFPDYLDQTTEGDMSDYTRSDAEYIWMRRVREQQGYGWAASEEEGFFVNWSQFQLPGDGEPLKQLAEALRKGQQARFEED